MGGASVVAALVLQYEACQNAMRALAEKMQKALAMHVVMDDSAVVPVIPLSPSYDCLVHMHRCTVSLYLPSPNAGIDRRHRLVRHDVLESSESKFAGDASRSCSSTPTAELLHEYLLQNGQRFDFSFFLDSPYPSQCSTPPVVLEIFARRLGELMVLFLHRVQFLRVSVKVSDFFLPFAARVFSVDNLDAAFKKLRYAWLKLRFSSDGPDSCVSNTAALLPSQLMKQIRTLEVDGTYGLTPEEFVLGQPDLNGRLPIIGHQLSQLLWDNSSIQSVTFHDAEWCEPGPFGFLLVQDALASVTSIRVQSYSNRFLANFVHLCRYDDRDYGAKRLVHLDVSSPEDSLTESGLDELAGLILQSLTTLRTLRLGFMTIHPARLCSLCEAISGTGLTTVGLRLRLNADASASLTQSMKRLLESPTMQTLELDISLTWEQGKASVMSDDLVAGMADGLLPPLSGGALRVLKWRMDSIARLCGAAQQQLLSAIRQNRTLTLAVLEGSFWSLARDAIRAALAYSTGRNLYSTHILLRSEQVSSALWPLVLESANHDADLMYFLVSNVRI